MKKYTILVTAAGGDIGQGVIKSLRLAPYKIKIIGIDSDFRSAGLFLCDVGYIAPSAILEPKKYVNFLENVCRREKIDMAFVCHESEQMCVARHIGELRKKTSTYFVVQSLEATKLCMNKLQTYAFLSQRGFRVPETYSEKKDVVGLVKKYGWPLVVKSYEGSGSRGFHLVHDENAYKKAWEETKSPLVQEYITNNHDEEYTVGIFLDKNSVSLGAISMLRRLRFGMTWHAIVKNYPDIVAIASRAAEAVNAVGPCNVQLRRDKSNHPCIIEINARISSTAVFRAKLGFNEAVASIQYFLENKIPKLGCKQAVVMKTWDELIVPFAVYSQIKKTGYIMNKKV